MSIATGCLPIANGPVNSKPGTDDERGDAPSDTASSRGLAPPSSLVCVSLQYGLVVLVRSTPLKLS